MSYCRIALVIAATMFASQLSAANPYAKEKDSWISISGKVISTNPDSFQLDYGSGTITVEMDDWSMDADGYKLLTGDNVTVNGFIDDDLYEQRTIEAGSVYVESLSTYFYASSADEEGAPFANPTSTSPVAVGKVDVTGTVTRVSAGSFTLDTGKTELAVDTTELSNDPTDSTGYQRVEKGDRIRVSGTVEETFFNDLELAASSVVTLDEGDSS